MGGHAICDWADLLQPKLKGKIAFLDSSRELVGAALKSLGCSYNTTATDVRSGRAGITEQQLKVRDRELIRRGGEGLGVLRKCSCRCATGCLFQFVGEVGSPEELQLKVCVVCNA